VTHHVVVVGGGFGGLPAARFLGHVEGVTITLVDRRNHHLFQPLLYQVATGMLAPGQIAPPLRHVLRRVPTAVVELVEVDGFDLERRVVHATRPFNDGRVELSYDSLIVAAGAGQSYFGHDEFALFAPGMKTIDDAMELRRRILGALELAETATDPLDQKTLLPDEGVD
jgi:NADH:ubiquinone reductase (H+-translocating)